MNTTTRPWRRITVALIAAAVTMAIMPAHAGATTNTLEIQNFEVNGTEVDFTINNTGPGTADTVTLVLTMPAGWSLNQTTPPNCTTPTANVLDCSNMGSPPPDVPLNAALEWNTGDDGTATLVIDCNNCSEVSTNVQIGDPPPEPDPTPAPTCPTGPVAVTADNADGARIAAWICNMYFVGTIWQGNGTIVLLPAGFFTCPPQPARHWYTPGVEFGYFLLQAQCGYTPVIANTWFGPWFAWDPPS